MRWIGVCERAFDLMCRRAATRELSPGVKLGSKQIIQGWIAESRARIDAARLMVLDAAEQIDRGGMKSARAAISTIKFFVSDVLMEVLDRSLQVHGGLGMLDDGVVAFWYRHERGARIYDGADEVHKSVLARQILASYGADVEGEWTFSTSRARSTRTTPCRSTASCRGSPPPWVMRRPRSRSAALDAGSRTSRSW